MNKKFLDKILLVYTGGTIGSVHLNKEDHLSPLVPGDLDQLLSYLPGYDDESKTILIENKYVKIGLHSFDHPIDSSNITPLDWVNICEVINSEYENYSGFVIIHGTDTMAYTASALSFMIENLSKPIIVTGSMRPIALTRTDGVQNLITSIQIAAAKTFNLPVVKEVCIFFREKLLRGCRTTKISASKYDGFNSPNFGPLGLANEDIKINSKLIKKRSNYASIQFRTQRFKESIVSITVFPGISKEVFESIIDSKTIKAVLLRTYGNGNAPSTKEFLRNIKALVNSNKIVINICQTLFGAVEQGVYDVSSGLVSIGVITGMDLTDEAAYTKLGVLLERHDDLDVIKELFNREYEGEQSLSLYNHYFDFSKINAVGIQTCKEMKLQVPYWTDIYKQKSDFRKINKIYLNLINVRCLENISFKARVYLNSLQSNNLDENADSTYIGTIDAKADIGTQNLLVEIKKNVVTKIQHNNTLTIWWDHPSITWDKCKLTIQMKQ